jgi:CrcB protein
MPSYIPIAISLGAIAGALSRYYIGLWITQRLGTGFPVGTCFVNLTGCFVMGLVITWLLNDSSAYRLDSRLLITTGFLGSYTTFSTYALESLILLRNQTLQAAMLYGLGSPLLGIVLVGLGMFVGEQFRQP